MGMVAAGNTQALSTLQSGYATQGSVTFRLSPVNQQILLHSYSLYNGSGSSSDIGLGIAIPQVASNYHVYTYNGVSATDVTAQMFAGTATTIIDTTNGHGFIIEAKKTFGFISFTVSQVSTGSPTYVYQYWNGSSWTTLPTSQVASYASATTVYITFNPPADWAVGDGGLGVNTGYAVRVTSGTAPTQAVQVTKVAVAYWIAYRPAESGSQWLQAIMDEHPKLLESGEALQPYFSTASNASSIEAAYQVAP